MIKNKKIILSVISSLLIIVMLALAVLAATNDTFEKGENYDASHEENGCCTLDSGTEPHYVTGYKDGLADQQEKIDTQQSTIDTQQSTIDSLKQELNNDEPGDTEEPNEPDVPDTPEDPESPDDSSGNGSDSEWKQKYMQLLSLYNEKATETEAYKLIAAEHIALVQEANRRLESLGGEPVPDPVYDYEFDYEVTRDVIIEDFDKQGAVNEYLSSDEFKSSQTQNILVALEEYKLSDEYKSTMNNQYQLGFNSAYDSAYDTAYAEAYDVVYKIGVADGYAEYSSTEQFKKIVNSQRDGAYAQGYKEGYDFGKNNTVEFDMTTLISLIVSIVLLSILSVVLTSFVKKKRRYKK